MDRRLTPANARVAADFLKGQIEAPRFVKGKRHWVTEAVTDLLSGPMGKRDRQLILGDEVMVYEKREGWCFVQSTKDGYVGYVKAEALDEDAPQMTHQVISAATHIYSAADLKSRERMMVTMGSKVHVSGQKNGFCETPHGFIPALHLAPIATKTADPVAVAQRFLGTPYLWGGNSRSGIDCSGLVQISCQMCGIPCPADSDMQKAQIGADVDQGAPKRGDLLFWKGHVAWVYDATTILHANGHHMAVVFEPLAEAVTRIEAAGGGPITAHKRLTKGGTYV